MNAPRLYALAPFLLLACGGKGDGSGGGGGGADAPPAERPAGCEGGAYDEDAMISDIAYLAAEELDGRWPGSEGDAMAREFIASRFACLGLQSVLPDDSYEEAFTDHRGRQTANVLGLLLGGDDTVSNELLVVSAHHDHFGDGRLGANDNASGVVSVLAIAAALSEGPTLRRPVLFATFGSEESGFEGSEAWYTGTEGSAYPGTVVYNLNLDMVGSYDQTEYVYALGTLPGTRVRDSVRVLKGRYPTLDVGLGDWSDMSDNYTFCTRGIPYLFMWTDDPSCYHEQCDTVNRIDGASLSAIADLTGAVTRDLADSAANLAAERSPGVDVCAP
jgi:hypothetical protein